MINKKAQAWGIDLIVGVIIFILGILIFFIYSTNSSSEAKDKLRDLNSEGDNIFNSILSEGYPLNWNSENVSKIGIISNGKINQSKLEKFYKISEENYSLTKDLFNTKYEYYFGISGLEIESAQIDGFGYAVNIINISNNASNLIKINRIVIYKDKPVDAFIYIWEKK